MNNFGLTSGSLATLEKILRKYGEIKKVVVFGSRATKNYKPGSDVDLAIWQTPGSDVIAKLRSDLDDSTIPYFFDIVDFGSLIKDKFKQAIERDGVVLWEKM